MPQYIDLTFFDLVDWSYTPLRIEKMEVSMMGEEN